MLKVSEEDIYRFKESNVEELKNVIHPNVAGILSDLIGLVWLGFMAYKPL